MLEIDEGAIEVIEVIEVSDNSQCVTWLLSLTSITVLTSFCAIFFTILRQEADRQRKGEWIFMPFIIVKRCKMPTKKLMARKIGSQKMITFAKFF